MIRLTDKQIKEKKDYIKRYMNSKNAADGSKLDANANVTSKNVATLSAELNKDINIQINRAIITDAITVMFGPDLAEEYNRQIEAHEIYVHDETSLMPYCTSITMYPFLIDGLTKLGGESKAPLHLNSFCGSFVNLVFAVSSQFAGAVATVEFLMYFDYFARKDYGDKYLETHPDIIANHLQHVVYAINQPAAARGYQSVFWNISIYDRPYFESMFGNFSFPDKNFTKPSYESVHKLQKFFMKWFNRERENAVLTFPVVTSACLNDGEKYIDSEYEDFIAEEYAQGNSFFTFTSGNAHALSSCCRLKNDVSDDINDFSYSLGAGGVATGSLNVITLNFNRMVQQGYDLEEQITKIHKYQMAYRKVIAEYLDADLLTVYNAGFISMDKQFLTIGINGILEAAEFLGMDISHNEKYEKWLSKQFTLIGNMNKKLGKATGFKFNTEIVPAENLGVKNAKWDRADGLFVPRDCYNSYFYKVEDNEISVLDKFFLHGRQTSEFLDGGSAYHCNLSEYPTADGFKKLMRHAVIAGCEYFCFNIKVTVCKECGYIDKHTNHSCTKCGSKEVDHATRVIGYLKVVDSFSSERQLEESKRFYDYEK
jgi:ribonucleoside-triphosphate reductase (formate)